jgi:putative ABC transport system substrate-binding protein
VVRSFDRPGGNLTGVTMLFDPLTPKKLQLLSELVNDTSFGFLVNPKNPNLKSHQEHTETAARELRLRLTILTASTATEIEQAFALAQEKSIAAVLLGDDPFFLFKQRIAGQSCDPLSYTHNVLCAGLSRRRRPDQLWTEL